MTPLNVFFSSVDAKAVYCVCYDVMKLLTVSDDRVCEADDHCIGHERRHSYKRLELCHWEFQACPERKGLIRTCAAKKTLNQIVPKEK